MKSCCCCSCPFPLACKWRGSVVWRVFPEMLLCALYTAGIIYVDRYLINLTEWRMPDNILSVLGVATGMLLVFRTNTSYERYYEGRKLWSDMTASIRSLIRVFWVMIDDHNNSKLIVEKITAVNLLVAFAYTTKHYLRDEYSYHEDDILQFIGHMPHLHTPSSNQPLKEQEELHRPTTQTTKEAWSRWQKQTEQQRRESLENKLKTLKRTMARMKRKTSFQEHDDNYTPVGSNIPLEITYHLSNFVKSCKERECIDHPTSRIVDSAIGSLVSYLTAFERIHGTPIPLAYCVHLTHVTWLVLLMLPFHWTDIGWVAVPLMALTSFALLGILGIGQEIEDPFGYDYNDLSLDEYCFVLHKEAMTVTSQSIPKHDTWFFSSDNHPIPHSPHLTAADLVKFSPAEVRHLLFLGKDFKLTDKTVSNADPEFHIQPLPTSNHISSDSAVEINVNEKNV